jgi:predicted RNA binding protein YcfA (HicA-like mRNA interferase family)
VVSASDQTVLAKREVYKRHLESVCVLLIHQHSCMASVELRTTGGWARQTLSGPMSRLFRGCAYAYSCVHMKSSADVLRALREDGWKVDRRKGSHVQLRHPQKPGLVTVPHPKKNLAVGTLRSIEKQSGLKFRS